jgi:hypothetical protein
MVDPLECPFWRYLTSWPVLGLGTGEACARDSPVMGSLERSLHRRQVKKTRISPQRHEEHEDGIRPLRVVREQGVHEAPKCPASSCSSCLRVFVVKSLLAHLPCATPDSRLSEHSAKLNCQRAIAQQIVDQGGDYVLAPKGNQGTLHDDVSRQAGLEHRRLRRHRYVRASRSAADTRRRK